MAWLVLGLIVCTLLALYFFLSGLGSIPMGCVHQPRWGKVRCEECDSGKEGEK